MNRHAAIGLLGQAAAIVASLLPILFRLDSALVFVVVVSGTVAILHPIAVLAAPHFLPNIKSAEEAARQVGSVLMWATILSLFLILSFWTLQLTISKVTFTEAGMWVGIMLWCQSLYTITTSELTRSHDVASIYLLRLIYGSCSLILMILACAKLATGTAIIGASCSALLLSSIAIWIISPVLRTSASPIFRGGSLRMLLSNHWLLATSVCFGSLAGQLSALLITNLGPFTELWAVILRSTSGFQTVGIQILGPKVDIDFLRARQTNDPVKLSQSVRRAAQSSIILGTLAASGAAAALLYTFGSNTEVRQLLLSIGCGGLFVFASVTLAPIDRLLGLAGTPSTRFIWELSRLAMALFCLLSLHGAWSMVALSIASLVAVASYLLLLRIILNSTLKP